MTITPEIQAVARAIYDSDEIRLPWEAITHDDRYFTFAIAAIRALRKPSDRLIEVGSQEEDMQGGCAYHVFVAMIDAALGENK